MNKPTIALTLGDVSGIGPELIVQALSDEVTRENANWIIVGNENTLKEGEEIVQAKISYEIVESPKDINFQQHRIFLIETNNTQLKNYKKGELSAVAGEHAGICLETAVNLVKSKHADAVVYGPLNKDALNKGGFDFNDDLHFFANMLGVTENFGEVNVMDNLWVTRTTSHIPLKDVANSITEERIVNTVRFANGVLKQANFEDPKLAVAALNPHAGDNGLLGKEEHEIIIPAIQKLQREGIKVDGPYPSDTVLNEREKLDFDCLVAMYHDQAQIGLKLLGFNRGVTINGGLPVVLVTPAHGTAFDIAGKGEADSGPIKQAIRRAQDMISVQKV